MRAIVASKLFLAMLSISVCVGADTVRSKRKRRVKSGAPSSGAFAQIAVDSAGGASLDTPDDAFSETLSAAKLTDQAMELVRAGEHASALAPFQQACLLEPENAGRWWVQLFVVLHFEPLKYIVFEAVGRIIDHALTFNYS
jgi:hypothetical protein